jgi:hypothetical protein
MLTSVTDKVRGWAAGILVATYAFGVLAPSMVFSINSNASIVHSLTEVHGDLLVLHFHLDDDDGNGSDKKSPAGVHHCCGVLAAPGLPPPIEVSIVTPICASSVPSLRQDHHAGCGPVTLDRPPRPSLLA